MDTYLTGIYTQAKKGGFQSPLELSTNTWEAYFVLSFLQGELFPFSLPHPPWLSMDGPLIKLVQPRITRSSFSEFKTQQHPHPPKISPR